MMFSISSPSIRAPRRRAEVLTRPRLLSTLDRLLDRKLTLVVAAAGYGKTTLLADFVSQTQSPVCWYTIDSNDQDNNSFLAHFVAAIARVFPAFGKPAIAALEASGLSPIDPEALVTIIVNDLDQHVEEHFILILDDYHYLNDNSQINIFLSRFVNRAPETLHLVIASRIKPKIPNIELLIAHGQAGGLDHRHLAFTTDEIRSIGQLHQEEIPLSDAQSIHDRTEGWITGILLSPSKECGIQRQFQNGLPSNQDVLPEYWDLLLADQPEELRDFLLLTAPFDQFSASWCRHILFPEIYSEDQNWDDFLRRSLAHNLFILPVSDDPLWLRYHSLFREHLLLRLRRERPQTLQAIQRKLIAAYTEQEEWDSAYSVCADLGDQDAMVTLITRAGPCLLKSNQDHRLSQWMERIPKSILEGLPELLSLMGALAINQCNYQRGFNFFDCAEEIYKCQRDRKNLIITLVRRANACYIQGKYNAALRATEEAIELIGDDDFLQSTKADAFKVRGASLSLFGRSMEGIMDLEGSLQIYQSMDDKSNIANICQELGIAYRKTGEIDASREMYSKALKFWEDKSNPFRLADLYNSLGVLDHYAGNYEDAIKSFDKGLELARKYGFARLESFLLASLGDIFLDLDMHEDAFRVYDESLRIAKRIKQRFLCFYLTLRMGTISRVKGNLFQACSWLAKAEELAESDAAIEAGMLAADKGRLAQAENKLIEAIQHYRESLN